ncbi:MAG: hypothetical protein V9F00_15550 [Nocardioides sp.]
MSAATDFDVAVGRTQGQGHLWFAIEGGHAGEVVDEGVVPIVVGVAHTHVGVMDLDLPPPCAHPVEDRPGGSVDDPGKQDFPLVGDAGQRGLEVGHRLPVEVGQPCGGPGGAFVDLGVSAGVGLIDPGHGIAGDGCVDGSGDAGGI